MEENNMQGSSWIQKNFLSVSILIAAVLIAGSIFYAFGRGGTSGEKQYPDNAFTKCLDSHKYAALIQKSQADASKAGVNGTPATYINDKFINGAQPWSTFQAAIEASLKKPMASWPATATNVMDGTKVQNVPAPSADDVILGDSNAPVTVIEYGDYQCPFCARFFIDVEPLIRQKYIETGKVKMIFRNYAFLGPESPAAAEAAECAKDQGQYWAYHDALYAAEHQDGQERNGNLNKDLFETIAQSLKLNAK